MTAASQNDVARERIRADSDFVTDRLSTQARGLAFGTLAVIWASMNANSPAIHLPRHLAVPVACCAVGTLMIDLFQYVVGYQLIQKFDRTLKKGLGIADYETWALFKFRVSLFRIKILLSAVTGIGLLLVVWFSLQ